MLNFAFAIIAASLATAGLHGHPVTPRFEVRGSVGAACISDDGGCGPMDRMMLGAAGAVWLNEHVEVGVHAASVTQQRFLLGDVAYHFGDPAHPRFYAGVGAGGVHLPDARWRATTELLAGISVPIGQHLVVRGGGAIYGTDSGFDTELMLSVGYRFGKAR